MYESLIAKLKDATEGSRELDSQLWPIFTREHGLDHPPPYTQSLDTAIWLLPPTTWSLSRWENTTDTDPIYWFDLHTSVSFTVRHHVPAIAVCIAALEAKRL